MLYIKRIFLCLAIAVAISIFTNSYVLGANYVQKVKNGRIDWTNGVVEAAATGKYPAQCTSKAQARAVARKKAIDVAKARLRKIIEDIPLDSQISVKGFLEANPRRAIKVNDLVRQASVVEVAFLDGQKVKAVVALNMFGDFAELVLPDSIKSIELIKQPSARTNKKKKKFTGLMIDCKGLGLTASMIPRVLDENGSEVFGPAYVSRPYVVKKGMACFIKDSISSSVHERIGDNPLVLKAIRTSKSSPNEIIISNADAEKVRQDADNLEFLHECRVVFVME